MHSIKTKQLKINTNLNLDYSVHTLFGDLCEITYNYVANFFNIISFCYVARL